MGAISPGRWQVMQLFTKIGATSLVKVTASEASAARAADATNKAIASSMSGW
jgi:hypothetical protein